MASWENLDFSPLASLPHVYRQNQMQRNRDMSLARLGQGASMNDTAQALIRAGDPMGLALLNQAHNERDFGFRQQEATRAQGNWQASHDLQRRTADEAARGYDYRETETPNGKELVRIHKQTGQVERVNVGGQEQQTNNPYMTGGAMNEAQSKDALYANRMMRSEMVLRGGGEHAAMASQGLPGGGIVQNGNVVPGPGSYGVENTGSSVADRARGAASDLLRYNLRSPEHQKFDQAKRDFINATLRRESGAVISAPEFDNANKQYFPMPGDAPETIEQKRLNRMEAIKGIGAGAGKGYRPTHAFDGRNEIIVNPSTQRQQSSPQASSVPKPGEVRDGYRFKGGNPADPKSWMKL